MEGYVHSALKSGVMKLNEEACWQFATEHSGPSPDWSRFANGKTRNSHEIERNVPPLPLLLSPNLLVSGHKLHNYGARQ
jgi:hypothetical protein